MLDTLSFDHRGIEWGVEVSVLSEITVKVVDFAKVLIDLFCR